ncbi:DNA-deoxyinosine glycosylase [Anaerotignum sp.]|nr:DNA-deoxyinosine glycosylase [Anaerotignum sp.]MBQ7758986.1 DNA-deoxyinosine glycosylase [Anaerotignum sp.]
MKEEKKWKRVTQEFAPVCDEDCKVLILGTAPSRKSREVGFYYGHPQNRFWKMLAAVTGEEVPQTIEEKKALLLRNHIALHDVIHSCDIIGSSDSSIRNVEPADLERILAVTGKVPILCNGGAAYKLYKRYQEKRLGIEAMQMPSTSPANAAWKLEMLVEEWSKALLPCIGKSNLT